MSFLPYDRSKSGGWYSSIFASGVAHAGLAAMLTAGAIPFLPQVTEQEDPLADVFVSLEIISVEAAPVLEPIAEDDLINPDDSVLESEEVETETPVAQDFDSLEPEDDFDDVAAVDDSLLPDIEAEEPIDETDQAQEPDDTELLPSENEEIAIDTAELVEEPAIPEAVVEDPEPLEPEIAELKPLETLPEAIEPEVIAEPEDVAEVVEPEDLAPTPEPLPQPVENDDVLAIEEAGLVADAEEIISPLAEGTGGDILTSEPLAEEEQLALLLPDTTEDGPIAIPLPEDDNDVATAIALPDDPEAPPAVELPETAETPERLDPESTAPAPADEANSEQDPVAEQTDSTPTSSKGRVITQPSAQSRLVAQVIRGIRNAQPTQCSLALPRRTGDGGVAISLLGDNDTSLDSLANSILTGIETDVTRSVEIVDARQCAALDALRQIDSYPATRIGISIDNIRLTSGDNLTARVLGAGGLFVTTIIIDDNGVVQNLDRFSSIDGEQIRIDAPVSRAGPVRDTRQLLLAIGSTDSSLDLGSLEGELAQDVFTNISLDQLKASQFSLVSFDLR